MQLTGIGTHISAALEMPARCTEEREERKTDLAGKTQVSKLCHSDSKVGDNFDTKYGHCQIKWYIVSTTRLYVVTYWDFGHGRALSQHFVERKQDFSESLFPSIRPG